MESKVEQPIILDLFNARKKFLHTIFWIVAASLVPRQLPFSLYLALVLLFWGISLYYTYIVYWKGMNALGVISQTKSIGSAGRVIFYASIAYLGIALAGIFLMGETTSVEQFATLEYRTLAILGNLTLIVSLYYTGAAIGKLSSEEFDTLPEQTKKYNYIGAVGILGDVIGNLAGGVLGYLGVISGLIGVTAAIIALINLYKLFKISSEEFVDEETKRKEAKASAEKVTKMKRAQVIGLMVVAVPILFLGYFIFKQLFESILQLFS